MIQQAEEEGQFRHIGTRFIHRQDEPSLRGFDQPVGIGHAFGNAFCRNQFAHVIFMDQRRQLVGGQGRIDCHFALTRSAGAAA